MELQSPTMHLATGRWAATTSRLADGRILIAGGYSFASKDTLLTAELLDPKTGTVTTASPMHDDRNFATATLLPDGKVLVAGGFSEKRGTLGVAEVYDPVINTWTPTKSDMVDHRELYTATPLKDGRVFLVGGLSLKKRTTVLTGEIYDPKTEMFTRTTGFLTDDRFEHASALLPDGRVLIVGGKSWQVGHPDKILASAEIFDPATGLFTATGSLRIARSRPTATVLPDGRILIAGGTDHGTPALMAEIYDPKTGKFSDAAPLDEGRMAHDACLLSDGRVLVAGGWCDSRKATTPSAEAYDPKLNVWSKLPDLPFSAHDLCLIGCGENRVLALCGKSTTGDEKTASSVDQAVWVSLVLDAQTAKP